MNTHGSHKKVSDNELAMMPNFEYKGLIWKVDAARETLRIHNSESEQTGSPRKPDLEWPFSQIDGDDWRRLYDVLYPFETTCDPLKPSDVDLILA